MSQTAAPGQNEEWLKVLGKGMVTLPKKWRDELGITAGDVVKAKKTGKRVIIEPKQSTQIPSREFSDEEIDEWLKDDKISKTLAKKVRSAQKTIKDARNNALHAKIIKLAGSLKGGPKDLSINHDKYLGEGLYQEILRNRRT